MNRLQKFLEECVPLTDRLLYYILKEPVLPGQRGRILLPNRPSPHGLRLLLALPPHSPLHVRSFPHISLACLLDWVPVDGWTPRLLWTLRHGHHGHVQGQQTLVERSTSHGFWFDDVQCKGGGAKDWVVFVVGRLCKLPVVLGFEAGHSASGDWGGGGAPSLSHISRRMPEAIF